MGRDRTPEYLAVSDMAEELAGLGFWRMDLETRKSLWSPNMYRIYGFEPGGEGPGKAGLERIHPEDRPGAEAKLAAALAGVPGETRTRVVWADGRVRHTEGRIACERGADGAVIAIYGAVMDVTERHATDTALAEHQAHLALLADHGGDVIVELDVTGVIRYASPSVRRYGYEPDRLVGLPLRDLVHPDELENFRARALALVDGAPLGAALDRTYRVLTADGGHAWVEGSPTLIFDDAGNAAGAISVLRDVTERRAAEAALAAREAHLQLIAEHTRDVVFQFDLQHRLLYASPAVRRYGYEVEELIGMSASELAHPDDLPKIQALVRDLISGDPPDANRDRTYRGRAKDGSYVWMDGQPTVVRDAQGRPISIVTLLRDITQYKAATEALERSETRYRLIADQTQDIIVVCDPAGVFSFVSPASEVVLGYRPEEMLGRRNRDFVNPDDVDAIVPTLRAYIAAGPGAPSPRMEYRGLHKDGREVWLEASPRAVFDAEGRLVELQDNVRDVTARKLMEDELRAARDAAETAAAVKSDFMANMSHEIRTPLTAVIGFSSLITARTDLDPTAREHADRITAAGRALLALVNDVLDFSKLEAGRMELAPKPVDPAIVAREALDLFSLQAESKGLELIFDPGPALPACVALDPKAVGQVLLNLLGNAVKFSEAGQVAMSLAYDPDAQVLQIAIRDSGPGLSPEQARRLFRRFSQVDASSTRRHGGTGLGLAISKGLVEAMGGEIGVDSVVGQGSIFHFEIPAPLAEAVSAAEDGAGASQDFDGLRLLVVDDNPINRELVSAILTPLGIEVTEAVDGASGLDAAAGLPFDIILLDIRMPGLDGPQVLARLRAEPGPNQNAPVLAFSAEFAADATAGFDDFVGKPLDPMVLIQAIAHWTAYETAEEDLDGLAS